MRRNGVITTFGLLLPVGLAAACGQARPSVDPALGVAYPFSDSRTYPGPQVACEESSRCVDALAEVDRWIAVNEASHLPVTAVTLHTFVNAAGQPQLMARSGGDGTWIAVIEFTDGYRTAVAVGCGVGISPERCFTRR